MDIDQLVRQAVRNLAFRLSCDKRELLLEWLPELLAQLELLRFEAEMLERFGAVD